MYSIIIIIIKCLLASWQLHKLTPMTIYKLMTMSINVFECPTYFLLSMFLSQKHSIKRPRYIIFVFAIETSLRFVFYFILKLCFKLRISFSILYHIISLLTKILSVIIPFRHWDLKVNNINISVTKSNFDYFPVKKHELQWFMNPQAALENDPWMLGLYNCLLFFSQYFLILHYQE